MDINLTTENQCNLTKSAAGGAANDAINSLIRAFAQEAGANAVANGNSHAVAGGEGQDNIAITTDAIASADFSALADGNNTVASGGAGDDDLFSRIGSDSDGSPGTTSRNSHTLMGEGGQDTIIVQSIASTLSTPSVHGALTSDNASVASGGEGNDHLSYLLQAQAGRPGATVSGDTATLTGGAGQDSFDLQVAANAVDPGAAATLTDNSVFASGGLDHDEFQIALFASNSGAVTISDLTLVAQGDAGADHLEFSIFSEPRFGTSSVTDNVVELRGGLGADRLDVLMSAVPGVGGTAIVTGNAITAHGGAGGDRVAFTGNGLIDNTVVLDGGWGYDTAVLDYSTATTDLAFDFTGGYDQTLFDGTELLSFRRVGITAGSGDDTFQGGSGPDRFTGGAGQDTAVFDGDQSDYSLTQQANGKVVVADLRDGAPDGTDVFWQVEAFVFADTVLNLA
ncbi:type I secretion target repeat protein [Rubellimicrobium mesophilum DSM 19309]|uniref:Type I secretion target repeat protein n=1 Tax=Rubellimicrobium mesophilum DSM 19309 TaxID=442562 RepID=A0A017HI70_9RHOB|nr:hypothetical protein [Rubellimicrobium mesophilum]EYD73863.1 type I secretion target repeat protein [Rubellimicrobium mesophilum DSM 19309]